MFIFDDDDFSWILLLTAGYFEMKILHIIKVLYLKQKGIFTHALVHSLEASLTKLFFSSKKKKELFDLHKVTLDEEIST